MGAIHIEPIPGDPAPQLKITIKGCPPAKDGIYYCDTWTLLADHITQPDIQLVKRSTPPQAAAATDRAAAAPAAAATQ